MTHTAPAIRIRFGLTPLERTRPWGREQPVLHWFGLTAGWYCVDLGGHEVLRYSERTLRELRAEGSDRPDHPYVDYYVVRLWEDLIALVSEAMEPVPADLADLAADTSPALAWRDTPEADTALTWYSAGSLYTDYLRVAPHIRCRRTVSDGHDTVTVAWEHRADPEGVIEFTGPQSGRIILPTDEFLAAVTELDRALMAAMDERIGQLTLSGAPPGVRLDIEGLRQEHRSRAARLQQALDRDPGTDWETVRMGVHLLLTPRTAEEEADDDE